MNDSNLKDLKKFIAKTQDDFKRNAEKSQQENFEDLKKYVANSQQENFEDLKQYVNATVSQQLSLHLDDFKDEVKTEFKKVNQKIDDVDLKVDTVLNHIGAKMENDKTELRRQVDGHEVRLTKLEQKAA